MVLFSNQLEELTNLSSNSSKKDFELVNLNGGPGNSPYLNYYIGGLFVSPGPSPYDNLHWPNW